MDKLLRLRGVSFEWKEPEKQGNLTGQQMGLVADEVEEIIPKWVDTDTEGYKYLSIRGFEALTIEAFRHIFSELEKLKKINKEFEDKIKIMEKYVKFNN